MTVELKLRPNAVDNRSARPSATTREALLALAAAVLIVPISNGRWAIPAAAWLAPLFLIYFLRMQKPWLGLVVLYALFLAAFPIQWTGLVPLRGMTFWLFCVWFPAPISSALPG